MAERELKATLAEKRDGVGIITLNRPEKLNAINQDIMDDLYYLFDAYEEDPEVRVIVLTGGDGKGPFCAGWRHRGARSRWTSWARTMAASRATA